MRHMIILMLWLILAAPLAAADEQVFIGVLAKRGEAQTLTRWSPTAAYLSDEIPGYRFTVVPLGFAEIEEAVADGTIDFVLTNSAIYVELEMRYGAGRIVTMRNRNGERGYTRFGGVIFTRAERDDLDSLEALRGVRFAAVDSDSLGGYLTARRELFALGIIPERHTALRFTGTHDAVVQAVLAGEVDAGTVRTDTLERMAAEGALSLEQIKVLNPQRHDDFDFLSSTRLYPEWPLARLVNTPEQLSHAVASALLRMPPQSPAAISGEVSGWTVPRNYQPVHELMREMRIGPYEYLGRITLQDLLRNYWHWLLLTLLALLLLTAATLYFRQLNRRLRLTEAELIDARDNLADKVRERTAELEQSWARLERISRDWNDAFDAISDPIFIHDAKMHIVQANPAYCQRAGHELADLVGKPYYRFFPRRPGPLPACATFPEKLRPHGDELTLDSGEVFISRSFGIQRADNAVQHALHILEDVTAERRAEARRRLMSRALEQAGEGVIILDRERQLSYCNPAMSSMSRGLAETLDSVEQLVTPHFVPALQGLFDEAERSGESASGEMELTGAGQHPVFITVGLIRDESGSGDGYVLTLLDLSEVKQAEQALTYRLGFESVIARLAARLVNVETDNLSTEVMAALRQLGEFSAVDRAYLFEFDDASMSVTYEWCVEGVEPQAKRLQQVPFDSMPWLRDRILADGMAVVPDINQLPKDAVAERREFEAESIQSLLLVALGSDGHSSGLIGFDNVRQPREWAEEDVSLLRAAGDILINAINRVRTLRNLERSEASLAAAQAIAHLGSWDWDIDSGVLAWSDEVFRIFGLQPHEVDVTYEAFLNTIHPDDRAAVTTAVNRAVAGEEEYAIDHRIVRPDGSERIVHEIGDVTFDELNKPRRMIGTVQDVTSLRRAEREARSLNRALRTLSLCNTTLVHATDEQALLERICRILIDNGGYRFAWVGYKLPQEEMLQVVAYADHGRNLVDSLQVRSGKDAPHPAGKAAALRQMVILRDIATAEGVDPVWREKALALGYGSVIALPLISNDELFGTITIDADSSDAFDEQEVRLLQEMAGDLAFGIRILRSRKQRERAEQALKQTEERYEELYENAPNAYISVASDGRLLQFNQALGDMLGYDRQTLETMKVFDLYADTEQGLEKARELFSRFRGGEGIRDEELQMRHADGQPVWVSVSIDPVRDESGEVIESRSMVIDITSRKLAEEERRQFAERLQRSLFQTIRAIALTIEKRDPYTAGHQERVAELAVKIGQRMGLDEQALEGVRLGALIHDIGKISVPAEILNRPGHLEPEMFAIIRTHPRSGYEIISGIDFPWPLAEMVLQHHERLDGSGYPRGLKGDEILLEARILAVADVVEAMASHRPYRASLGSTVAMDEIEQGKGTIYDPKVVEQCQAIFDEEGSPWPEPER